MATPTPDKLTQALRAARDAGATRVEVSPDGTVVAEFAPTVHASDIEPWKLTAFTPKWTTFTLSPDPVDYAHTVTFGPCPTDGTAD